MKVKVAKWGNSLGIRLPSDAAQSAGIKAGSELELTIDDGRLQLGKPYKTSAERLAEMLAEIDRRGLKPTEMVDWGPDRGSEIIDDAYSRGEITLDDILGETVADEPAANPKPRQSHGRARRR